MLDHFLTTLRQIHETNPQQLIRVLLDVGEWRYVIDLEWTGAVHYSAWKPSVGPTSYSGGYINSESEAVALGKQVGGRP